MRILMLAAASALFAFHVHAQTPAAAPAATTTAPATTAAPAATAAPTTAPAPAVKKEVVLTPMMECQKLCASQAKDWKPEGQRPAKSCFKGGSCSAIEKKAFDDYMAKVKTSWDSKTKPCIDACWAQKSAAK